MHLLIKGFQGIDRPSRHDYRWVTGLMLGCYLLVLLISEYALGDYRILWRYLGVPAYKGGLFHDLKVITYAMDCLRAGRDPLMDGSCTPGISFNYPTSWYILRYTGMGSTHTVWLATGIIIAFFGVVFAFMGRSSLKKALLYGLILISPPFMLAIERCNNDLFFFILLFISLKLIQKSRGFKLGGYGILLSSALLKIHPVFAFGVALRERKNYLLGIILPLLAMFILYGLTHLPELEQSSKITPRPFDRYSFGSNVLSYYYFQDSLDNPSLLTKIKLISWSFTGILFAGILWISLKKRIIGTVGVPGFMTDAFRMGVFMFLGNFILGNNYDYRLIFLLLCLPQLFFWVSGPGKARIPSALFLVILLILVHYTSLLRPVIPEMAQMWTKAVLYWTLAGISLYLAALSLPSSLFNGRFSRPFSAESR